MEEDEAFRTRQSAAQEARRQALAHLAKAGQVDPRVEEAATGGKLTTDLAAKVTLGFSGQGLAILEAKRRALKNAAVGDPSAPTTPAGPTLPRGWDESVDAATSEPYYFHAKSGHVSWAKPEHGRADSLPGGYDMHRAIPSLESTGVGASTEHVRAPWPIPELPVGWLSATDPASGQPYFFREDDPRGSVRWIHPSYVPSTTKPVSTGRPLVRISLASQKKQPQQPALPTTAPAPIVTSGGDWVEES
jgi:hypothetical protein